MLAISTLATPITNGRAWQITDTRSRTRLSITMSISTGEAVSDWHVASLLMLLVSHLGGSTPDDVEILRIDQPLGTPSTDASTRYDLQINKEPIIATIVITSEFDAALDGEADDWQRREALSHDIYPAAAQLAFHISQARA